MLVLKEYNNENKRKLVDCYEDIPEFKKNQIQESIIKTDTKSRYSMTSVNKSAKYN